MLNDDDGTSGAFLDFIDQHNGLLAGGRVQVGKGFIEQQYIHFADHNAAKSHALFLSAGDFVGRMLQNAFNIHEFRNPLHFFVHFLGWNAVVFQGKCNILCHSQADKLTIRVLQYGTDHLRKAKQAQLKGIFAAYRQAASGLTGIGVGN